ncbi:MAG: ATP-binding cassette domain-containing protein [Lachnospiraceae bacterium]|nr:ATP-binding cassette domain-containing protein [Lachnospiraceae bacterium]
MENIIELKGVSKSFYGETLFEDISLEIKKGGIIGFVGENGCGKSVLFKMICGLISPDTGTIRVMNRVITEGRFPTSIGVMLDGGGFVPYQSGFDNLKQIAVIDGKIGNKEIEEAMEQVGLDYKSKKPVKKYSLGMKQRLGIAMALMENPMLLFLDEPMNALDKDMTLKVRDILLKKKEDGVTILLTSHNQKDIDVLCSQVYRFDNGRLIQIV